MAKESKTVAPVKEAKAKKASIEDVLAAIGGLTDVVSSLVKSTISANEKAAPVAAPVSAPVAEPLEVKTDKFPVPQEYRLMVETILNKKFDVEIDYIGDIASFQLAILVPRQYSNAAQPHWDTFKEDRRAKVIANALGMNGVREWATKVYENFPNETKSQIVFDRAQL